MAKRRLSVTRWLGGTPAVAVCVPCSREFKVPLRDLASVKAAQGYLLKHFEQHVCDEKEPLASDPKTR
jgi:hypothetical protein